MNWVLLYLAASAAFTKRGSFRRLFFLVGVMGSVRRVKGAKRVSSFERDGEIVRQLEMAYYRLKGATCWNISRFIRRP